jgi:hypothetical protein
LKKKGVNISFLNWEGEAEPYDPFHEVWVNVEGIPFEWLGVLLNVDCPVVFKNFYKKIRSLVAVRDISKIPTSKLHEMEQEFFYLKFGVEKPTIEDLPKDDNNGGGDEEEPEQDGEDEDQVQEDYNDPFDNNGMEGATRMDTYLTSAG